MLSAARAARLICLKRPLADPGATHVSLRLREAGSLACG